MLLAAAGPCALAASLAAHHRLNASPRRNASLRQRDHRPGPRHALKDHNARRPAVPPYRYPFYLLSTPFRRSSPMLATLHPVCIPRHVHVLVYAPGLQRPLRDASCYNMSSAFHYYSMYYRTEAPPSM